MLSGYRRLDIRIKIGHLWCKCPANALSTTKIFFWKSSYRKAILDDYRFNMIYNSMTFVMEIEKSELRYAVYLFAFIGKGKLKYIYYHISTVYLTNSQSRLDEWRVSQILLVLG